MGNNASTNNGPNRGAIKRRAESPRRPNLQGPQRTEHGSQMGRRKKSLELPDLAPLTPIQQHHTQFPDFPVLQGARKQQPRTSSPIAIPNSPRSSGSTPTPRSRQRHNFSSTQLVSEAAHAEPSTHIPINSHRRGHTPTASNSSHPTPASTRSFVQPTDRMSEIHPTEFVGETIHSTLPIPLLKAREEGALEAGVGGLASRKYLKEDPKDPVTVEVVWHGGGHKVELARAGDDDWKGRQPMERMSPTSDSWVTKVDVLPGTHHIKFLVDDQWRVAADLPAAVDDEGSLANYVAVPIVGFTPPASLPANTPPRLTGNGQSFWSTSESGTGYSEGRHSSGTENWTSELPSELIAAFHEEETYLTVSSAAANAGRSETVPAPNIPPAPLLPRHLDKLILNVRPNPVGVAQAGRTRDRDRDRERRSRTQVRSTLGMTSADDAPSTPGRTIPVTTASGTDVSIAAPTSGESLPRVRLDGFGMADDASVLPVPSHVVLHHLSTSAIRNGVLAVGNTTRYKQKYLTTIYYKPT